MPEARSSSARLSPYGLPGGPFQGTGVGFETYNPNMPAGTEPPSSLPKSLAWDTEADTAYWLSYRLGLSQAAADNGFSFAWANSNGDGSTAVGQFRVCRTRRWRTVRVPVGEQSPSSRSNASPEFRRHG